MDLGPIMSEIMSCENMNTLIKFVLKSVSIVGHKSKMSDNVFIRNEYLEDAKYAKIN